MLEPLFNKVIIKVGEIENKIGKEVKFYMTDEVSNREQLAKTQGEIVALGPLAFGDIADVETVKIGDVVYFQRYGGLQHIEENGDKKIDYRIVNDNDIVAIVRG